MKKTSVKFRKNRHRTVGGVAHTRYPLSIHFDIVKMSKKRLSSTCGKSDKKNFRTISKPHAYLQTMNKTPMKF